MPDPIIATDPQAGVTNTPAAPYSDAAAITKSDDDELPRVTNALYVGGAGNLSVVMADGGDPVTLMAVPVGAVLPIRVRQVLNATTATNLVALY